MQTLLDEQVGVAPEQSPSPRHCTHAFPAGLTLQRGSPTGQSCACVALVQIGTQALELSQRSPAGHCAELMHATQTPGWPFAPGSQCGRLGSVHCESIVQLTFWQTLPDPQLCPAPQSFGQVTPLPHWPARRHATHLFCPPLMTAQCGSAVLLAQPESSVQTLTGAWQV